MIGVVKDVIHNSLWLVWVKTYTTIRYDWCSSQNQFVICIVHKTSSCDWFKILYNLSLIHI